MINKKIILQQEISVVAINYELQSVNYSNLDRVCKVKINLIAEDGQKYDYPEFTLWSGEDYVAAGQWTDSDVESRILEILNS